MLAQCNQLHESERALSIASVPGLARLRMRRRTYIRSHASDIGWIVGVFYAATNQIPHYHVVGK